MEPKDSTGPGCFTDPTDPNDPDDIYLAVFGDIHGRVALMYTLAHMWEQREGAYIHAILQVGDMGAFPDHTRLDKATRSHAKRDSDELDFVTFSVPTADGARYLDRNEAPPTWFIRGNHEDFAYLDRFASGSAVDPWGKLHYIDDGGYEVLSLSSLTGFPDLLPEGEVAIPPLVLGGFGGIEPGLRGRGKKARRVHRKCETRADRDKYFDLSQISTAFLSAPPLDVLMTHAGPKCDAFPGGCESLNTLARRVKPAWHFFGHHHAVVGPTPGPGGGQLVGLEHLDFSRSGSLQDDAWGILRWSADPARRVFAFANQETMPWLREVRRHSYRGYLV